MGLKDYYIITIYKGEETVMLLAKKGDRIKVFDNKFLTAGNEVPEQLKELVRMDPVTRDNKYKIKQIKQNMKKNK